MISATNAIQGALLVSACAIVGAVISSSIRTMRDRRRRYAWRPIAGLGGRARNRRICSGSGKAVAP